MKNTKFCSFHVTLLFESCLTGKKIHLLFFEVQSLHSDVVRNVLVSEPSNCLFVSQLGCGTHRRILSALCGSAGAGGRKRDPRPSTAGEEDETTEEEHAAGEGQIDRSLKWF